MDKPRRTISAAVIFRRLSAVIFSVVVSFVATDLFIRFADNSTGMSAIDTFRCALIAITTLWLAWGAVLSLLGLLYIPEQVPRLADDQPIRGRTVVLVPVYNEDPVATFSRIAAMDEGLAAIGASALFDFAILSDTTSEAVAEEEALWWARLVGERRAEGRIFYRRRTSNIGKKAGNIEDFVRRSGAAYEYAVILDADSLMDPRTMVEMVRRMEADPTLGLLQTLPKIIHAQSFFGRAIQFSASYFSPVFARGVAMLQGNEGPFWGHNALVRVAAFAESCGLPPLSGKPPLGGHIMSHDYVEAALLARGGWKVRLDPDLEGSFEESPQNLLEFAKRDRRWCQGNMQYVKLVFAPNFRLWSRFVFAQGIMAYIASPIWLIFLLSSLAAPFFARRPDYFPEPHFPFPIFPADETIMAVVLMAGIWCLLVLPKVIIVLRGIGTGDNASFGGTIHAFVSTLGEIVLSSLLAPLMLWFQSKAVFQVLLGADGGWSTANRGGGRVSLSDAWQASRVMTFAGILVLVFTAIAARDMLGWLLPIGVPMVISPLLIWLSSQDGRKRGVNYMFLTPNEIAAAPALAARASVLARWEQQLPEIPRFMPAESVPPAASVATERVDVHAGV